MGMIAAPDPEEVLTERPVPVSGFVIVTEAAAMPAEVPKAQAPVAATLPQGVLLALKA